jgi:hypothetical protein
MRVSIATVAMRILALVLFLIAIACVVWAVDSIQTRDHLTALAIGLFTMGVLFGAGGLALWGSMKLDPKTRRP